MNIAKKMDTKVQDRLVEIIDKTGTIKINGEYTYYFTPEILAQAILKEFIHVGELPKVKEHIKDVVELYDTILIKEAKVQGFNQCLTEIKKQRNK